MGLSGRGCHGIWGAMGLGLLLRAWASLALESGKEERGGEKSEEWRGQLQEKLKGTKRGRGKDRKELG